MTNSEWIALGALIVAALSWLDSIRRVNATAIKFQIERDSEYENRYRLRNIGTRTAREAAIDTGSVSGYELGGSINFGDLRPGASRGFTLKSSRGDIPDEIGVKYGLLITKKRLVPFHALAIASSDAPKPTD